ncbi:hypothetical protein EDB84DRAFT_1560018 [Lactarius hengduanensis]|nr:hypothetical protein EDB84DRAFT_1560018 [Lactarius hengduanensis]
MGANSDSVVAVTLPMPSRVHRMVKMRLATPPAISPAVGQSPIRAISERSVQTRARCPPSLHSLRCRILPSLATPPSAVPRLCTAHLQLHSPFGRCSPRLGTVGDPPRCHQAYTRPHMRAHETHLRHRSVTLPTPQSASLTPQPEPQPTPVLAKEEPQPRSVNVPEEPSSALQVGQTPVRSGQNKLVRLVEDSGDLEKINEAYLTDRIRGVRKAPDPAAF